MNPSRAAKVATVVLVGLVLGGLGFVLSLLYDVGVPLAVCLVTGVLICAGGTALADLPREDAGDLAPGSEPVAQQRSSFGDLHALQSRFAAADGDAARFEDRVRRPLADLAVERLRTRQGSDDRIGPEGAQAHLDPVIWQLLTAPAGSFPARPEQAAVWVHAIESL